MKETGISMFGDHPKKILDGTKTMTRRTYGLEKINESPDKWNLVAVFQDGLARFYNIETEEDITLKCPYGGYGDRLWVRETWTNLWMSSIDLGDVIYKATPPNAKFTVAKWKPSIHMPRWASRITLEITELRVERVQEITEEDAKAEGALCHWKEGDDQWGLALDFVKPTMGDAKAIGSTHTLGFRILWDSLNAKRGYGWDFNPWVWPIGWPKYSTKNTRRK